MRPNIKLLFVIGLGMVGAVALAAWAGEDEEILSIDQVPPAVKATILKQAEGGTINEIERELEDGKMVYEAEIVIGGKAFEIEIAEDGTLLGKDEEDDEDDDDEEDEDDEEEISIDQIPAAARHALMQQAGKHKIEKAGREQEDGVTLYEAQWTVDGRKHEAEVTAEGALVELEEVVDPGDVPAAVRAVAAKKFPANAKVEYEKKMIVVYELEAEIDGKEIEVLVAPTGQVFEEDDD